MTESDYDAIVDDRVGPQLVRYFAGECSTDEARAVRAWIETDARRGQAVAELARVWQATEPRPDEWNVDRAWAAILAARSRNSQDQQGTPNAQATAGADGPTSRAVPLGDARRYGARRVAWAIRACAAAVVIAAWLFAWPRIRDASRTGAGDTRATAISYATPPGRRSRVRLADGTDVLLGVASRLRVGAGFAGDSGTNDAAGGRDVWLEGEALLTVVHDARRPFRVHARGAIVEDAGTTFDVRAYPNDSAITVFVASGRTLIHVPANARIPGSVQPTVLVAGSLATLGDGGAVRVDSAIDVAQHLAWTNGQLVFRDTPLRDALAEIARWYDVDVSLADTSLASRRITATFGTASVDDVLDLVARSLGISYEHRGRRVIVRGDRAP